MNPWLLSGVLFFSIVFSPLPGCNSEIISENSGKTLDGNSQIKLPSENLAESSDHPPENSVVEKVSPFCDTECQAKRRFLDPNQFDVLTRVTEANINGRVFQIELADTESERSSGLMNRQAIADNNAMLFVFENKKRRSFWMKNTLIPLDLIFLSSSGEVLETYNMNTEIGHPDSMLKIYRSTDPVKLAMEIRSGLVEEIPILVGSYISFR